MWYAILQYLIIYLTISFCYIDILLQFFLLYMTLHLHFSYFLQLGRILIEKRLGYRIGTHLTLWRLMSNSFLERWCQLLFGGLRTFWKLWYLELHSRTKSAGSQKGWKENTMDRTSALHVADISLIPSTLYDPSSTLGVISEHHIRSEHWALPLMAPLSYTTNTKKKSQGSRCCVPDSATNQLGDAVGIKYYFLRWFKRCVHLSWF